MVTGGILHKDAKVTIISTVESFIDMNFGDGKDLVD